MSQSFTTGPYEFVCDGDISDEMEDYFRKVAEKAFNDAHDRMLNLVLFGTTHPEMYSIMSNALVPGDSITIGDERHVITSVTNQTFTYSDVDELQRVAPADPEPDTSYQQVHGSHNGMSFPSNRRRR